jgi:MFS family permease
MTKKLTPKLKKHSNLTILYLIGLILAVSSALPAYVQSNFLNQFISLETLSLFFIAANAITVFCIISFPKLIKKLSNFFLTRVVLVLYGLALLSLTMTNNPAMALFSIILFTVSSNLLWINMDVLVETFSENASTGQIRTIYFTFINLGWIISPSLSSQLINLGDYQLTFFLAALLAIPVFFILAQQKNHLKKEVKYHREDIRAALKMTWKNKNLRGIFFIALLLQIFYNTAVVYLPIYLHQSLGIAWSELGLMFSIMLIPFLIFEIPAGIIADKYIGEKEILFLGFLILVVSLFLFFYVKTSGFWLWAGILFLSRIGASLIEAMRETHFFKLVDAKDIGYINIFRTTSPLGYIIGPVLAIIILAFLPINYIFLGIAILTMSSFYFIYSIEDTK